MKKIIFFLFLSIPLLRGQKAPLFSIYRDQNSMLNPAMPNSGYLIGEFNNSISATYRYQWLEFGKDAPITQVLNWEWEPTDRNIIVGATLYNDRTGLVGMMGLKGQFAYKLELSPMEKRTLSIGLSAGAQRNYAHLGDIAAKQGQTFDNTKGEYIPDLDMGVFYNEGKLFYLGLSSSQILGTTVSSLQITSTPESSKKTRAIYAMGGFFIDAPLFGNDAAYLEPTTWIRYVPGDQKPLSIDVNIRAKISNAFWVGTGYNAFNNTLNIETGSVLSESIGINNGELKIGMSFGIPLGLNWGGLGGIGEVHLSYAWGN